MKNKKNPKHLQVRALDLNVKEMNEKKNDLITRAEGIVEKAKTEKRDLTDEEMQQLTEIKEDIKKIKRALKLNDDFENLDDRELKDDKTPTDGDIENIDPEKKLAQQKAKEQQEVRAFEAYVRGVVLEERAADVKLTKSDNGAIIPTTIANKIIKKIYNICPILENSTKYNVKGNLDIPYYDSDSSTINVAYQQEFVAMTSSSGKFNTINLTGFLAGALSKISKSLINNNDFNIVDFIVEEMADAIKRFIERELLVGTPNKVTGLSTLKNVVKAKAQNAITTDELIKTQDAVPDEYQNDAIWIMSSKTRTAVRLLKDANGRYMLQDDVNSPFGKTLLGKPVYVSDNMPEIGAGNAPVYYGNMKGLATKFSEEISIDILREKYADEHAVGVIGWFEFDSKVQNEQMLSKLVCANA